MVKIFQIVLPIATVVDQVVPQALHRQDSMHAMHELIEQENLKNYCKSITSCKRVLIALEKMQTLGAKIATHRNLDSEHDLDQRALKWREENQEQQHDPRQKNLEQSLKYHPAAIKNMQHRQIAIETMAELQLDRFSNHDLDSLIDYESKLSRKHNQTQVFSEGILNVELESTNRQSHFYDVEEGSTRDREREDEELEPLVPLLPDENTVIKVDILQESYGSLLW